MKKIVKFFNSYGYLLIFPILLLAAFLRLYRIQDYLIFLGDEGRDVYTVYRILHGHLTLLGPAASVGGFFLGPIYYYFMTPFLWIFNYNPIGPAVMVALFGIATVYFVYKVGSEFFNKSIGLIAAFFYAMSPLVIAYSRSSWNPNILPFFSLLTLYLLYRALKENRFKLFLFSGISLGISLQLHYLAVFLGIIMFAYVFLIDLYKKQKTIIFIKHYLTLFFGFLIGFSPFLAFEVRHGFSNTRSIIKFVFASKYTGGGHFFAIDGSVFVRVFARLLTDFPSPNQAFLLVTGNVSKVWFVLVLIFAILAVILLIIKIIRQYRAKQDPSKLLLLFLWLFFGSFLFGLYKSEIYDYYFALMFTLPFFMAGFLINNLYTLEFLPNNRKTTISLLSKILAIALFLVITIINIENIPFRYPPNRQLNQARTIASFIYKKADNKPFNFALITGSNYDYAYRYFFEIWGNPPVTIQNSVVDPKRKTVTKQLFVVCESLPCYPLGDPLWEIAGFGRAQIVGKWNIIVVQVYKLVHYVGK